MGLGWISFQAWSCFYLVDDLFGLSVYSPSIEHWVCACHDEWHCMFTNKIFSMNELLFYDRKSRKSDLIF